MVFAREGRIAEAVFTTVEGDPMQPRMRSVVLEDNALWQNAQLAIGNVALCDKDCMYAFQKWFQIFLRPFAELQLIDSTQVKSWNAPKPHPARNSTMANQPCYVSVMPDIKHAVHSKTLVNDTATI